ncbi:MAG: hypothetical protein KUG57_11130 [Ilumatobacteraceae bacterium]|nr:hypothetical protein [Ilumatobacteraceae bacterium]
MAKAKIIVTRWFNGETPLEELPECDQLAHQIVSVRADLAPSVTRIMDAELPEDDCLKALTLFETSLDQPGDPNRDPRVAIASVS